MKKILLFLFILTGLTLQAQKEVDSLQNLLKTTIPDTTRVNALVSLATIYSDSDLDKAIDVAKQGIALAEKIGFRKGEGNAYRILGYSESNKNEFLSAIQHLKIALKIKQEFGDKKALGVVYTNIGFVYGTMRKNPEALESFLNALRNYEAINNSYGCTRSYNNIGLVYYHIKDNKNAMSNFEVGLSLAEKNDYKDLLASFYMNMANIYGDDDKDIAGIQKALTLFDKAEKISIELGDDATLAAVYHDKAATLERTHQWKDVLNCYTKALKISEKYENQPGIAFISANMGNILNRLERYQEANQYLNKSLALSTEMGMYNIISDSHKYLYDRDSILGNYAGALHHYIQHIAYRDSVFNDENKQKILEQQVQYDFDKKEAVYQYEQQLNAEELKNKKTTIVALVVGLFALILAAGLWYVSARRKQALKESLAQQQFSQQLLETTEEERGRIARDLHDGVNQELLLLKRELFLQPETAIASEKVDNVIKEIRHISRNLHPMMLDSIGLRLAIETLCEQYMESTDVFITYEIEYNDSLPQNAELQVFRVVQEALTNTLKYANAKACRVEIADTNGSFSLKIQDNGTGFDVQKSLDGGKSFGLNSIIQRAKVIGATAKIQSSEKGTVIELKK